MKKARSGFAGTLAVALIAGMVFAAPSWAAYVHPSVTEEFGSAGTSGSSFSTLNTLAYQQATDRIYVLDVGAGTIYGFSHPSASTFNPLGGSFPLALSGAGPNDSDIAVDNSAGPTAGNIYGTPDGPEIKGFTPSGSSVGTTYNGEGEICGVAVDNAGNIWGGRYSGTLAVKFTPGKATIASSFGVQGSPCKIAVDPSNNDVFSSAYGSPSVSEFTSGGTLVRDYSPIPSSNARVAINATRHVAYIGGPNGEQINAFDTATGGLLETIEPGGPVKGIAVDEATDTLFVSLSNSSKVKILPGVLAPKATTADPTANTTVSGTADPDGGGPVTECYFQYKLATEGSFPPGNKQSCNESLPINSATSVSATLPGLLGETEYKYRLVVANATPGAVGRGAERSITPHNVKGLKTEDATGVTRTTADLHLSFEGDGTHTTYYFEWGTESAPPFSNKSPIEDAGSPLSPPSTALAYTATGLTPQTVYRFRVVGTNTTGVSPAAVHIFETLPAVPGLTTGAATEITQDGFTLNGEYVGNGESTHYYFEYGSTAQYGQSFPVPEADAGSPTGPKDLQYVITDFLGYTTYHYRIVASNVVGKTFGQDMTVTTLPAPLPVIAGSAVSDVGATGATLHAAITPNHWDTVYRVQYGVTPSYGSKTLASESIGTGATPQEVSQTLSDLVPGTTYHARIQATNFTGISYGPDLTFTTLAPDSPAQPPPPAAGSAGGQSTSPPPAEVKPPAKKCKKGFVRKHGKCVKKPKQKHHRKTRRSHR